MSNQILQGVHDFVLHNPQFNQTIHPVVGSGLEKLFKASTPSAFHDSAAREPSRCHPGTRLGYINRISAWGSSTSNHPERILWMQGPAGVGKSSIAQSCAELLAERDLLGAAFFFSRPNNRDDPTCLFTSISYQLTTILDTYADLLDHKLQRDPAILKKSIARQFHELLVKPLQELREEKVEIKDYTIIIDGLDECAGIKAQQEIVKTIAKSVRDGTTPFRWAFFSRPESHIIASFRSDLMHQLSWHLELPVSRKIDHEILCYLTAELKKIREEHKLPPSWPSEEDFGSLVDRSAGLFIYASTVIRFIGDYNSSGPVNQLHLVLLLTKRAASGTLAGSDYPLSELDQFYALIIRRVPPRVLSTILKILLLHDVTLRFAAEHVALSTIANSLRLSEAQFRYTSAALCSVLELDSGRIKFYHASFLDFLRDPDRSKEFCIYGDCLDTLRQELLERLNSVHAQSTGGI